MKYWCFISARSMHWKILEIKVLSADCHVFLIQKCLMVWSTLALPARQKRTRIPKRTCKTHYVTQFLHKNLLFKHFRIATTFPLFMPLAISYRIFSFTNKILFKNIHFCSLHKDLSLASSSTHVSTAPWPPRLMQILVTWMPLLYPFSLLT